MTREYTVGGGFIWKRNVVTVLPDGGIVKGGYMAVRPATILERLMWALFKKEPSHAQR